MIQAAGRPAVNVLSHVPGDRDHGVSVERGDALEHAQQIAGHASPKTTKLYDRTADRVTVDEILTFLLRAIGLWLMEVPPDQHEAVG